MFEILDFIIIGVILFISIFFAMIAKRVFFGFSFPKNEITSFLKIKGLLLKSYKKISLNDIPNDLFFKSENLFYNIFLFRIIYFEIKAESLTVKTENVFYVKYYKAGMTLFLKDKISFISAADSGIK